MRNTLRGTTWLWIALFSASLWAGVEGTITGRVTDPDGIAVGGARVTLLSTEGTPLRETKTSQTGEFQIFPVAFSSYQLKIEAVNFAPYQTSFSVASGSTTDIEAHLLNANAPHEMVLQVQAKRHLVQNSTASSRSEVTHEQIRQLPQGDDVTLPKIFANTTPGAVQGPFGQTFFRGNHADIQYQIDGVQLPDSPSNTFGQAFSPRNIDHMEVVTGGIPAEYGERLAAVVNIATKSGAEEPGGSAEINYGSYNTFSPTLTYGGSTESGVLHYYASANYMQTDRGLDTPQPKATYNQGVGGEEAIHDKAQNNTEFLKLDWFVDNSDKLSFVGFSSASDLQIPNYPSSFTANDPLFNQASDAYGNAAQIYVPSNTNDHQSEVNAYGEVIWKHTFSDRSFVQVAPYYKYSYIHFQNDPVNDLISGNSSAASFYESRNVSNLGIKTDYTLRLNEQHLFKAGFQIQSSEAQGRIALQLQSVTSPIATNSDTDHGAFESVYAQDDYTINKRWTFNLGLRFDATQFTYSDSSPTDTSLQPRIGVNYLVTDTTKLHAFYGKLFQPSPVENLRATVQQVNGGTQLPNYDIKAEKDDYYEVGIAQQFLDTHVALLNVYYKNATNMLDDAQLFNTAIAQPYNYANGYAYGAEFSIKGEINSHWSEYLNYSYEIAKGRGIGGGGFIFLGQGQTLPADQYKFLDHVQVQTANAGVTYKPGQWWWTTQGLYGSGLRTDPTNGTSLPAHLTFDTTIGYEFKGESWASRFKLSADILNIFDNPYAISVANGFNGSHYAAGREYFLRLTKEL